MKYNYALLHHAISIEVYLEADAISLYATNSIDPKAVAPFQHRIERLLTEDPDALYMERLARNTEESTKGSSGLGLLTMINDYQARLAWKFTPLAPDMDLMLVTTMVHLTV